jgi:hypothetical protein
MTLKFYSTILIVFITIKVYSQDTLEMFFNKLPRDLSNSVRLIDINENKDYPRIILTYGRNSFGFESEGEYEGIVIVEIDSTIITGFFSRSIDTWECSINCVKLFYPITKVCI